MMPKNKKIKKNRVLLDSAVIDTEELDPETKEKIHTIVIDSNHSAHQILKIANETKKIGEDTRKQLDKQAEQIDSIDRNVQELDYQAKKNKRTVRGINSVWWAIVHFFTPKCLKPQKPNFDDAAVFDEDDGFLEKAGVLEQEAETITVLYDGKTKQIVNDTSRVLSEANVVIHDLESLSTSMNKKLRKQNKALDKITDKTDDINDNLRKTSKYARSYLGEPK